MPARETFVEVPWGQWPVSTARLSFPEDWDVVRLAMADRPALESAALGRALDEPVGTPPLTTLAHGHRTAAIAIDDATRPTNTAPVLADVIRRLTAAGIDPSAIVVVVAGGAHRPADARDIALKVGDVVALGVQARGHDAARDTTDTGVLLGGVPVRLNEAFLRASLRIGIGGVLPHPFAGFSGGAKVVVPGLADLEVLTRSHKYALMGLAGGPSLAGNRFRGEMEKAVRQVGLHFTVNLVLNDRGQTAGAVAGDMVAAHREAARLAGRFAATAAPSQPLDALVLNAWPKDIEVLQIEAAFVALRSGMLGWLSDEAPVVLTAACPRGLGEHGLFGPGGRLYRVPGPLRFLGHHPLWIHAPGAREADVRVVFHTDHRVFASWPAVIRKLQSIAPAHARVGIVPCGALQLAGDRSDGGIL